MAAITSKLASASGLLLIPEHKRRHDLDGNLYSIPIAPDNISASSKLPSLEIKTSTSIAEINAVRPSQLKAQSVNSNTKRTAFEKFAHSTNTILKTLRIPAVVILLSLLMMTTVMNSRQSALAISGGSMGGSSSSSRSRSGSRKTHRSSSSSRSHSEHPYMEEECNPVATILLFALPVMCGSFSAIRRILMDRTHLITLQMGLLVTEESLQKDLNKIAKTTDTSTARGWRRILEETINSLFQHRKYWISAYSDVASSDYPTKAKKYFEKLSKNEREKFSEETLVNVNNIKKECSIDEEANQLSNTYLVITILVAITGVCFQPNIPEIIDYENADKALRELSRICEEANLEGVHVLWAPQKQNDYLSLEQLQKNYPNLRPFKSRMSQMH